LNRQLERLDGRIITATSAHQQPERPA